VAAVHEQWAVWWRYRRWHGIAPGTWCGYFGGRSVVPVSQAHPPFWRYDLPGHQLLFSGYHMSSANLDAYVAKLRRRRPPWLHGYPSLLALLAAHLLETGTHLGYELRWVTIGAENLLPQQAALMERAFGVRPRQHYGMTEATANVSECERGSLHVDEDFAAVEFIDTSEEGACRIVGTNFTNPAMPLIRYDSHDVATFPGRRCGCRRAGRTVERIDGREEDYVVIASGARLGRMDHIFKDMTNVREAQIRQRHDGEITLLIVRGRSYDADDEAVLLRETRKRVGDDTRLRVEYVEELERTRTGKLRLVVREGAGSPD
jgi:phenylacetate-CoA ligase